MASSSSKQPTSFADGVQSAMQALAAAMSAPDADLHFGSEMIKVMGVFLQAKQRMSPGGPPGAAPGGGMAPGPGAQPPGPPPGMGMPGGPAGGGAANPAQPSMGAPTGPQGPGGGPTPGLTPNPDEMRRVLQEVAGQ